MSFANEKTFENAVKEKKLEEVHSAYEGALDSVPFGVSFPNIIGELELETRSEFEDRSPIDHSILLGRFPRSTSHEVNEAIRAARDAFEEWSLTDWSQRVSIFKKIANVMRNEKFLLAAAVTLDNGKNRYEAIADVDEAIDFIEFYCDQMALHEGFIVETPIAYEGEKSISVMRPYGIWAIICPFNFPVAITTGMATAAMITGNTVIIKPSSLAPLPVYMICQIMRFAGLPPGVLNFVAGPGAEVGDALIHHPEINGIAFTGSKEIGYSIIRSSINRWPRPVIAEMGGKNAIIVSSKADLDDAVDGVVASAFGYGGQKCSACSRVIVFEDVVDVFIRKLIGKTQTLKIGDPRERDAFLGPVISEKAADDFVKFANLARTDGKILTGGLRITGGIFDRGYYVEPTVVADLPSDHFLIKNELFLPFLCVQRAPDLEEAIKRANDVEYGLTGGIFTTDEKEIEHYFDHIEAGVVYANRRRGGSTGAMVGAQPFGGWKASGSTGKGAGGSYYLMQFMKEQSRTRCQKT
ncbi:MAG: aldehyde dehydrogenase family protein [Methanomassiliicoccales archaeon]|jgi:1-pyrroline-5-carboxylate dehydrogenase|nr:aldehyde dehydrogenase family protein [Methanomassiliicoccales archaeon]